MPDASTRTCTVSVARMLALADEFLLLKAQIAAMQGRLELVLTEIAMELEPDDVGAGNDGQHCGGSGDKAGTTFDETPHLIAPQAMARGVDHPARDADRARNSTDSPHEVEGSPAGSFVESSAGLVGKRQTASLASPFPYNAIVLRPPHEQKVEKSRLGRAFHLRWAAATIVTAVTIAAAVGCVAMLGLGRSFAGSGSVVLPFNSAKQASAEWQPVERVRIELER